MFGWEGFLWSRYLAWPGSSTQCAEQPVYSGTTNPDPKRQLTHFLGHQIGSPV